jgi:hypothetical protein
MQWLYRVRARIYRVLLAMYGGKQTADWNLPAPADEEPPPVYVADSTDAGSPPKSKGEILKALKSIASANESIPAGNLTRDEVMLYPQLVANVTKRKDFVRVFTALEGAQIHYTYRRQGGRYQFLVASEDVQDAVAVIAESYPGMDRCPSDSAYEIVVNRLLILGGLFFFGFTLIVAAGYFATGSAPVDQLIGPVALSFVLCAALIWVALVRTRSRTTPEDP